MLYDVTKVPLENVGTITDVDLLTAMSGCVNHSNGKIRNKDLGTGTTFTFRPSLFNARHFVGIGESGPTMVTRTGDATNSVYFVSLKGFYFVAPYDDNMSYGGYSIYYNPKTKECVGFSRPVNSLAETVQNFIQKPDVKLIFQISLNEAVDGPIVKIWNNATGGTRGYECVMSFVSPLAKCECEAYHLYGDCYDIPNTGYTHAQRIVMEARYNGSNQNQTIMNVYKDYSIEASLASSVTPAIENLQHQIDSIVSNQTSLYVSR